MQKKNKKIGCKSMDPLNKTESPVTVDPVHHQRIDGSNGQHTASSGYIPSARALHEPAQLASQLGKTWVLEPLAAGASEFRIRFCLELVGLNPTVFMGNAYEIMDAEKSLWMSPADCDTHLDLIVKVHGMSKAEEFFTELRNSTLKKAACFPLLHAYAKQRNTEKIFTEWESECLNYDIRVSNVLLVLVAKGVDSSHESTDAVEAATSLSQASRSTVSVSGAVDIVTDGHRVVGAHNGVPMLQKITATGCSVTALIAALVAVDPSHAFEAKPLLFPHLGLLQS
ncbi:Hydroxyethylthiazole kinase [Dillenia turbinata]|uniref:hydroxyethylthiazole kinase n=1 Tax=Dillenia turbinata TaxID=194707 RepID=A0AAN8UHP9_9MAGN